MRLNRSSLKDQALEVIRQGMVSGEIRPGQIYSTASLAAQIGTSNGPVREAMLSLRDQGIVEAVPNRGFRVLPLTDHDLDEVYEVRLMLEVPAMRRLAHEGRLHGAALNSIREHARKCEDAANVEAKDLTSFLAADRDFHLALVEALGNTRLVKIIGQLRDQTRLYGIPTLAAQHRLADAAHEHFELLDAIVEQDADTAEQVMTTHLAHVRSDWASESPLDDGGVGAS